MSNGPYRSPVSDARGEWLEGGSGLGGGQPKAGEVLNYGTILSFMHIAMLLEWLRAVLVDMPGHTFVVQTFGYL